MKMIEKIIRAMQDTGLIDGMSVEDCDTLATAALEAMREPTMEMSIKGADVYFSPEPKTTEEENNRAAASWREMIDAALNE